ncbi:MAG: hypothetical protein OXD39_03505 [Gemmatimonadetes bacterium]|nr:hypothetical protein [Gemmatimonadota bacterium]
MSDPDGVECRAEFKGHEIRVFSTWTQDARLYIDGVCRDRSIRRVSLQKMRILSTNLRIGTDDYRVEVFAKALLSIRLQLRIDGRQVAGEVF